MDSENTTIKKERHGSQAWLTQRWCNDNGEKRVSASAAAAIYEKHPFISPAELAAELLSPYPPEPKKESEAMERGNRLESTILKWANDRLGRKFKTPNELFCFDRGQARLIATLDGYDGTDILEIKTTTREFTGELPDYWKVQGIHQAICAGVSNVIWAIFDKSQTLNIHKQFVSSDDKECHINAVADWLSAIDEGVTPDGVGWTYESISNRYPQDNDNTVELGESAAELVARLKHVKSELKSYEALEDEIKAELCEMIGEASTALINGRPVATWKTSVRSTFNTKLFKLENPDMVDLYTNNIAVRTLRLKGSD